MTRDETAHWLHKLVEMWRTGELEDFEWHDRLERLADRQVYEEERVPAGDEAGGKVRWKYVQDGEHHFPKGVYVGDDSPDNRRAIPNQYGRMVNTRSVNTDWRFGFHPIQEALINIVPAVRDCRRDYTKAKEEEEEYRAKVRIWADRMIRGLSWAKVAKRAGFGSISPVQKRCDEMEQELCTLSPRDYELRLAALGIRRFNGKML